MKLIFAEVHLSEVDRGDPEGPCNASKVKVETDFPDKVESDRDNCHYQ